MATASSVVDVFVNRTTLSLAAVAVFALNVFGVTLGDHDTALGLALLAGSRVAE